IRLPNTDVHDQKRTGEAMQALADGADYLVIGRALTSSPDPEETLRLLGFETANA
ncbi:MAG: orotidine 5'-phosphate decarboxylase, partial [Fimbriimonadaceae bacterium]|nr:orotidine 5'-phosphate decarboxylase [Fimbriimonadaceae bacterium]